MRCWQGRGCSPGATHALEFRTGALAAPGQLALLSLVLQRPLRHRMHEQLPLLRLRLLLAVAATAAAVRLLAAAAGHHAAAAAVLLLAAGQS
jgi:hypothetical protein